MHSKGPSLIWSLLLLAGIAAAPSVEAAGKADEVRILMSSPACVQKRLGQVSVSLGSKEPNPRTGMAPTAVSYRKAFVKLADAARQQGGDAVVLRGHDAAYVTKGARVARRPTYLSLQGAVIVLDARQSGCLLAPVDPVKFEQEALSRERQSVVKDTGMAF